MGDGVIGGDRTEGRDGYRRPWAAAVVSRHVLTEIDDARATRNGRPIKVPFVSSRPGSWVAANVRVRDIRDVTAISLYGLMDGRLDGCPCTLGVDCMHSRTRLDPRYPKIPYQMDYLFASPALAERLNRCSVLG